MSSSMHATNDLSPANLKEMFYTGRIFEGKMFLLPDWEDLWFSLQEMEDGDELDEEFKWMEAPLREVMMNGPAFVDKAVVRPFYKEMWNNICEGLVE
jgi:hypothetical protein